VIAETPAENVHLATRVMPAGGASLLNAQVPDNPAPGAWLT
jgi:hypothetical protein